MRVASINLPIADNSGNSLADVHACLQADIVDSFGGFTRSIATGGWRDDATGRIYVEEVAVYSIACEDSAESRRRLVSLALWHGRIADQLAVYVVHANGEAEFVNCRACVTA